MPALSSIGLVFSACSLAAFFWPESKWLAASFLPWLYSFLATSSRTIEQRGELAAGGGEFRLGLALAVERGVDDRTPALLVGPRSPRFRDLSSFSINAAARLLVLGVGRRDAAMHAHLRLSPRHRLARRPGGGSRAARPVRAARIAGSDGIAALEPRLELESGRPIVRRLVVVVLTMTHSGRNSRGGPGRAPRRSSASR